MLEIQNMSFAVSEADREKEIIHDLSLTIENGKFVVVTGPNGSGKSTLARLIMGIEKPISGRILLDGEDITELDITERAKKGVSFAFQQPVRFKGIRVQDLLRLAAGRKLSVSAACAYLSEVDSARATTSTARSIPRSPAASSSASRSPRCSPGRRS